MPRVIVTTDSQLAATAATARTQDGEGRVLLDESVDSLRLSDEDAASRFVERLGWAISDAEETEPAASISDRASAVAAGLAPIGDSSSPAGTPTRRARRARASLRAGGVRVASLLSRQAA